MNADEARKALARAEWLAASLDDAERVGTLPDEPEGAVMIRISDTLARDMAADLRNLATHLRAALEDVERLRRLGCNLCQRGDDPRPVKPGETDNGAAIKGWCHGSSTGPIQCRRWQAWDAAQKGEEEKT